MLETSLQEMWRYARETHRHYEPTKKIVVKDKEREFDVPKRHFKSFLKKLHNVLKKLNLFHHAAHGGIKKRSPQTSAKRHCGKKYNWTRDIKSCFPSVTPRMIHSELYRAGFLPDTAKLLSLLLTVHGRVPQGANTSTDAINLLFLHLDGIISRLCKKAGFVYTRYVVRTVNRWRQTLGKRDGNLCALVRKKGSGQTARLSAQQKHQLKDIILAGAVVAGYPTSDGHPKSLRMLSGKPLGFD